jgi:hypothetical protein
MDKTKEKNCTAFMDPMKQGIKTILYIRRLVIDCKSSRLSLKPCFKFYFPYTHVQSIVNSIFAQHDINQKKINIIL